MSRDDVLFAQIKQNPAFDPSLIEQEIKTSVLYLLVPAIATWIVFGVLVGLGFLISAIVVLGIGLTAIGFLLATRFLEQVVRMTVYTYLLSHIAVGRLDVKNT
jgi:hypothetical protein